MFIFKGVTPLMWAAKRGHRDIVNLLLNQGANVNDKNNDGKFLILFLLCRIFKSLIFNRNIITI